MDSSTSFARRVLKHVNGIDPQTVDEFGRYEYSESNSFTDSIKGLILTIPWGFLIFQLLWTGAIVGIGYAIGDKDISTFTTDFWSTRLSLSSDVSFGVGWALFVFLGFFTSAASARFYSAQVKVSGTGSQLSQVVRHLCQGYTHGVWHDHDFERILGHLVAYPICLKMQLRGECDRSQLEQFLHSADVDDILKSHRMHLHCSRVVRAYFSSAEHTAQVSDDVERKKLIAGFSSRYFAMEQIDDVDTLASAAMRIHLFKPSVGYVNHLRIYLYIWMMFLPMSLISDSGW